jgi:hypothetical protein
MWHVWRKRARNTGFRLEEVRDRDHLEYLGLGRMVILKCYKMGWEGVYWIKWLRIGRCD